MDKQRLLQLIAMVVPQGAREMVPHAIKEPIVNLFSTEKPPPPPHFLELPHLLRPSYDVLWREVRGSLGAGSADLFERDRERQYELCNAIAYFFPDWRAEVEVLEVRASDYAALYRKLFPRMRLVTLDRPESLSAQDPSTAERFDLVLCTEPVSRDETSGGRLVAALVARLKPHGLAYLTTPSRDIAMSELHAFAEAAQGRVITSYYSDCWDPRPPLRCEDRSSLVAVIARKLGD